MRAIWRNYARRLREQLAREAAALPCLNCGMRHAPERRAKILRRMLPTTVHEIREAWPCIWGEAFDIEGAGARMIYRDLHAIGAVRVGGSWYPQAEARAAA